MFGHGNTSILVTGQQGLLKRTKHSTYKLIVSFKLIFRVSDHFDPVYVKVWTSLSI